MGMESFGGGTPQEKPYDGRYLKKAEQLEAFADEMKEDIQDLPDGPDKERMAQKIAEMEEFAPKWRAWHEKMLAEGK